jgi:hypothetical protein
LRRPLCHALRRLRSPRRLTAVRRAIPAAAARWRTVRRNCLKIPPSPRIGLYALIAPCRIWQREVFSKLLRATRRFVFIIQSSRTKLATSRQRPVAKAAGWELGTNGSELRIDHRNVEAASPPAIDAPGAPSGAPMGSSSHSGRALPLRLARTHPSLILSPRACHFVFDGSLSIVAPAPVRGGRSGS